MTQCPKRQTGKLATKSGLNEARDFIHIGDESFRSSKGCMQKTASGVDIGCEISANEKLSHPLNSLIRRRKVKGDEAARVS